MRFASVCSGIGAPECAWLPLGWHCEFTAEIEPFPSAVLKHHYPNVPNYGDITRFKEWPLHKLDVLIGGTPCQSFSVAGLRKGLADPRGNLALTFLAIVERYAPTWVVWENVPGVLSSDEGRAFGAFLGGLAKLGHGFAYRVLDAQYFGLAQRRKRVFVVGHIGGQWQRAAAVLFERESLCGNPAPGRETGEGTAPTISASANGGGGLGTDAECDGALIARSLRAQSNPSHREDSDNYVAETLRSHPRPGSNTAAPCVAIRTAQTSANGHGMSVELAHTLDRANGQVAAFGFDHVQGGNTQHGFSEELAAPLRCGPRNSVGTDFAVRRLTPRECERLQGFPDDYTLILHRNKPAADGPRYKALGNSMAVPCIAWIGKRIEKVNKIK